MTLCEVWRLTRGAPPLVPYSEARSITFCTLASLPSTTLANRRERPLPPMRLTTMLKPGNRSRRTPSQPQLSLTVTARDSDSTRELEEAQVEKLRRDLSESRSQIAELQRRCEAQSRDLGVSNSFLATADKSSDSDIIRVLQRLNAEVEQNVTYMADLLVEGFEFQSMATDSTMEQMSAVQRVTDCMGPMLAHSLGRSTAEDTPMLLQIALQACLLSQLVHAVSSWVFEPGHNAFIDGISHRLRSIGEGTNARIHNSGLS